MQNMVPGVLKTTVNFLEDSDAILDALEQAGVGIWRWPVGSETLEWTRNLEVIHRQPPGTFDGTLDSFAHDIHPDDRDRVWDTINTAVETGKPYEVRYRTLPSEAREPAWISARGATVAHKGQAYLTGICADVTREVEAEEDLNRRVRHLAGIAELGSFALGEDDFQKVLDRTVEVAAEMFDVPLTKVLQFGDAAADLELRAGIGWKAGLVGQARVGIDRESQAGYTLASAAQGPVVVRDLKTETRFSGPPLLLDHGVVSGMSVVIQGMDGRPFGVFGIHDTRHRQFDDVDVASLRSLANVVANAVRNDASMDRQKLLTREIEHRANNLLQIINVIAKQTFRPDIDPETAKNTFQMRLSALSRTNGLISQGGWAPSRIRSVIEEVLLPYRDHLSLSGRDILLPPQMCFDVALVLHELATNSVKYGSLGNVDGNVAISWAVKRDAERNRQFELEWRDPTTRFAQHGTGFGRTLKKLLIEEKWSGRMTVDLEDGYRFACSIPLQTTMAE